jgi:hypothetical protein
MDIQTEEQKARFHDHREMPRTPKQAHSAASFIKLRAAAAQRLVIDV